MVSTLTPAALAKGPMVSVCGSFTIALDSVLDYGSNLSASRNVSEGDPSHGRPQQRPRCTGRRWPRRHPRLDLLPRSAGADHAGFLRRLDRQLDRAGTVPADLHWRGARGAVLRVASHLPAGSRLRAGRRMRRAPGADGL